MTRWNIPPDVARRESVGFLERVMPLADDAEPPKPWYVEPHFAKKVTDGVR